MRDIFAATLAAAALVSGCATPNQTLTSDDLAQLAPVECRGADQCGKMWQRAQIWIVRNSAYKIQLVNDTVIETFSPAENSTQVAYTVFKEPRGGDLFVISTRAGCRNMFGCFPHPDKGRAALHRHLRETPL